MFHCLKLTVFENLFWDSKKIFLAEKNSLTVMLESIIEVFVYILKILFDSVWGPSAQCWGPSVHPQGGGEQTDTQRLGKAYNNI